VAGRSGRSATTVVRRVALGVALAGLLLVAVLFWRASRAAGLVG